MIELGKVCRPMSADHSLVDSRQQSKVRERELPAQIDSEVSFDRHPANRFSRLENGLDTVGSSRENPRRRKSQLRSSTTGPASLLILL
jgi:hypothetical protein